MLARTAWRWCARRWLGLVAVAAVVVTVGIVLGPELVGLGLLVDVNLLTRFAPWSAGGTHIADTNICRSDTVDNILPGIAEVKRSLLAGRYPQWDPYPVGGVTLATPNVGQFSPLALPYYVLPLWLAPAWVKLAEIGVILVGTVALLRRLRLEWPLGLVAGLAYATSGYMVGWSNWPQSRVGAFIPALFWSAERLVQERRARSAVPVALVVAAMLLGGFPSVTGMALYTAVVWVLVRLVVIHRRAWREVARGVAVGALGIALGAMLSAFQLLPFLDQLRHLDLSYREGYGASHEPVQTLVTLVAPGSQGLCIGGQGPAPVIPIESVTYVGAATLVLVLVAALLPARVPSVRRGVTPLLVGTVVVILSAGWFGGPVLAVLRQLPVFSNNPIARIRAVLDFLLAVLAALGLRRLLGPRPVGRLGRRLGWRGLRLVWQGALTIAVVVVAVLSMVTGVADARRYGYVDVFLPAVVGATAVGLGALAAVVVALRTTGTLRRLAVVAVVALVVGQGTSFAAADLGGSSRDSFYPVTPVHAYLQAHLGGERFGTTDFIGYASTAPWYELRTPVGHQFLDVAWRDLLQATDPDVQIVPTLTDFTSRNLPLSRVGDDPLLDRLAVRYWMAADTLVPGTVRGPSGVDGQVPVDSGVALRCPLPAGPTRGVVVTTVAPLTASGPVPATISVEVDTAAGPVTGGRVLTTTGTTTGSTGTTSGTATTGAAQVVVPLPGEGLSGAGPLTARVTLRGVGATALAAVGGTLACGTVGPADDGLVLVQSAPGATLWERPSSLPRVRWASRALVVPRPGQQVADLSSGVPRDTVLLDAPAAGVGGTTGVDATAGVGGTAARPAGVRVTRDIGGDVEAVVDAQADGYLVVADALGAPGWTATVDGRPTALVTADHAFGAVAVPSGRHTVAVTYRAPGLVLGAGLGLLALLACLALALGDRLPRIRRGSR